jgi:hypothetical protein
MNPSVALRGSPLRRRHHWGQGSALLLEDVWRGIRVRNPLQGVARDTKKSITFWITVPGNCFSCVFAGVGKIASLLRFNGESAGARTQDQRLKRAMLYQLSYALRPHYQVSTFQLLKFQPLGRHNPGSAGRHVCRKPFICNSEAAFSGSHLSRTTVSLT